ncbi:MULTISPECIES: ACP S-malonyltransferase [Paenibacillus]|uniref:ACP S-malonyltransferase n=1 Tax=Paenibacillus TaxID=44249 RepID=UPI0020BE5D12|nr:MULTISPECIES: ACP S-malonyltransferase [Paenibacillus]MDH6427043.1 [acyl-carrier-protein] S-malonyltransferase [Paenibacillus sp. PastH-4]MDH6443072.1 [acyl-carrier-protein] S-malonyltransferase [Paenibacillus sp. PastF-4]MDH6526221.1 [acyl-carrier-protein] S-malonyltransferase [Paenibacillus sp. PastH-3]
MSKIAFVFPGQGAQAVGMGRDVYEALPYSRAVFEKGDEVLGFPLSQLIFEGPDSDLKQTVNTQPALLTASVAYLEALRDQGMKPDYVAGHSLGEYSALVAAGVLSYEDAVRLVRLRGRFMEEAVPGGQGAMAAVLGAERDALAELCRSVSEESGVVELANVNCPGQIVVSGSQAGVNGVVQRVKEAGGKRAIPLEVSGPFHSSMMKAAADRLADELKSVTFNAPAVPVIVNVTAAPVTDPEEIRELLVRQVYSPVLWQDSIEWLIADGVDTFVEIGSGSVLAGLIRKIDKTVKVININTLESVQAVL